MARPAAELAAPAGRREASATVAASPETLFAWLDDHERLAAHMSRSSAMMGGGRMTYAFDEGRGRQVGSHITMGGEAFGLKLFVDEMVTERTPPRRKVWRTVGVPKLVVIGAYEMGFEIEPANGGSHLRVWISYRLPDRGPGRRAGVLARLYARWCVQQMTGDALRRFGPPADPPADPP